MKNQIDALMSERNLDVLVVIGPAQHNPAMVYLTGGGHLTSAILVKPRDAEPVLFYNSMEREEAARTGLKTADLSAYSMKTFLEQSNGDMAQAMAIRFQKILEDQGITQGRIALEGLVEFAPHFAMFSALQTLMPGLTLIGETGASVLAGARKTKEQPEIERIRKIGQITTGVVGQIADFLTSQRVKNDVLVNRDGDPITIGEVKRYINLWLAERGAENPEGTIFAIGHDAGVPHSTGTASDMLRLGQTIVFDIFPCEAGGGYFYDFTRTWCLGYAPDAAQALYQDVYQVYQQVMSELQAGQPCQKFQARTCELFEAQGHPTVHSHPRTQQGYVHSLGHGLGLDVHEAPWFSTNANTADVLAPGVVVTIEPGLYYPEKNMGCRLEDTVWVRPDGSFEVLAEYPLDLVLPVKNRS